jgi:hypothetical protein
MDHLFNRLDGMYPNKWRANFSGEVSIQSWREAWAEAFIEDGIVPTDIRVGITNCRRMYDWPPSLAEFSRACRPNLAPEAAFTEAVRGMIARNRGEKGDWSHPAIFWAAVRVTSHELMSKGYAALRGQWERTLSDTLAAGRWEEIPGAHVLLAPATPTAADRVEAAKVMSAMGASGVFDQRGRDERRWITKILDRVKNKERVPLAVADMARRATGEGA